MNKLLNFYVKVWKDDTALYFPNGETRSISCNHVKEGTFGVNIRGEVFAVQGTTYIPVQSSPPTSPPTSSEGQTAIVQAGNVYGTATPFASGSANYKTCVRVKDLTNLVTSYVDADDYATNVVQCNFDNED